MQKMAAIALIVLMTGCVGAQQGEIPQGPGNATAWCGNFEYTGTFTKSEASGSALGVSDAQLIQGATIQDIIALAQELGCNR